MVKSLADVLNYAKFHTEPGWSQAGFGPTSVAHYAQASGHPVETTDVDAPINLDQDFKKKLMAFFDTLGEILIQDYPHEQSVFDTQDPHKDGHRHADQLVGESVQEAANLAVESLSEAVVYEVGRLYEANVSFRGLQRKMKIFFPSMKTISRKQIQEQVSRVLSGAVILEFRVLKDGTIGRVSNKPLMILENLIYDEEANVLIVAENKNCSSEEMKASGGKKKEKDKKKKKKSPMVSEIFDQYVNNLAAEAA